MKDNKRGREIAKYLLENEGLYCVVFICCNRSSSKVGRPVALYGACVDEIYEDEAWEIVYPIHPITGKEITKETSFFEPVIETVVDNNDNQQIVIDTLCERVRNLEISLKKAEERTNYVRKANASSSTQEFIFKGFLVEKHPELTSDLARFVLNESKNKGYCKETTKPEHFIDALDYHADIIECKELDEVIAILEKDADNEK